MTLSVATAEHIAVELLSAVGMKTERAQIAARCIGTADVWGKASHGLLRLPYYLQRMTEGGYPPDAELSTVSDNGPVLALDGGGGLGHWQLWRAAEIAVIRCRRYGVTAVSVGNSGHCGALGLYTVPGVEAQQIVLAFSNGPAVMPAWGSSQPRLSTSPLAAGIPTRPRATIVDMATSAVARGKIAAHAANGEPLPEGWALDRHGQPTVDPEAALRGMLSPLGGAKGFALALLVEALTGGLGGPNLSAEIPDMFVAGDAARPQRIGHLLLALDPQRFDVAPGDSQRRLDRLAASVTGSGARLPGAGRPFPREIDGEAPLTLAGRTLDELRAWADRLGATLPAT